MLLWECIVGMLYSTKALIVPAEIDLRRALISRKITRCYEKIVADYEEKKQRRLREW